MLSNTVRCRLLLGSILGSVSSTAFADTVISTETSTPLNTQSAGNITVQEDGSIDVDSGTPITINSGATVTIDDGGTISATGGDDFVSGILVTTTSPFTISNDSDIDVTEDFVPDDDDSNNIPDGAIASATDRAGIRITSDAQGTIDNGDDASIYVEGLNSYGIIAEQDFKGDITNTGTISVVGDYSKAISLQGVDGNLQLDGSIFGVGEGAQAVVVAGDVTGAISIQGSVGKGASFTNDDGVSMSLSRGDLRVRAAAVEIAGNVEGGILIASPPYDLDDNDDDEDNDGVDDDEEGTGAIQSYGVSPALYIGGSNPIDIGGVKGRDGTFSLAVDGNISSSATYSSISTVAVEIGGDQQTTLGQGIGVSGSITATTYDSGATAILINQTGVVPALYNSGSITASISSPGDGSTIAIQDLSGTLTQIENSGTINATGSREDVKVALDLSNAQSGVTVHQYLNDIDADTKADEEDDDGYNPDNPTIYTAIYGDLLLSKYNDTINESSGLISGRTYFGDGDDTLSLSDDAAYNGDVHGGLGQLLVELRDRSKFAGTIYADGQTATLNLFDNSKFTGSFADAGNLTANVNGGKLIAADGETASFGTLNVGSNGTIGIIVDGENATSSSFNVGTANFADGSKLDVEITSISNAEGTYEVLTANQLSGAPTFDPESNDIPLLYNAELDSTSNSLVLTIERKTAEELGLSQAQGAAYEPIIATLADQETLEKSILQADSLPELRRQFQELLPDYSGGIFEFTTLASRIARSRVNYETRDFFESADSGGWLAPYYFKSKLSGANSEKLTIDGKGVAGALEFFHPRGTIGVDVSYTGGNVSNGGRQQLSVNLIEVGTYFRRSFGPFYAYARIAAGQVKVKSEREFDGVVDGDDGTYKASGDWSGVKLSGSAGVSAKLPVANRLSLIPTVNLDYQWLKEKGYSETGDDAILLTVDSRRSSRLSAIVGVTASFALHEPRQQGNVPITFDLGVGRGFNLINKLGATTANFDDGNPFSIVAPSRSGNWQGELKVHGGDTYSTWAIMAGGEKGRDQWSANVRAALTFAF